MALDVKIIINMTKPVGSVGFGCPLILEENATKAVEYTECSSLHAVTLAGYENTSAVYKVAQLMFMQDHAPKKIAVCSTTETATNWLGEEKNISKDWRQLVTINSGNTATAVGDIMTAIEAETKYPKMFYANLPYDDKSTIKVADVKRTILFYYTPSEDIPCPVAALAGEVGGLEVGSYTLNNMTIKGVDGLDLNDEEIDAIHAKGGITLVVSAGDNVVSEGKTAGGSFVDNVDGDDWIKQQLEYNLQKVFNNNLKVPYTDTGIALLEGAAMGVMKTAVEKGIVHTFEVKFNLREDTTPEDRANRRYVGGNITYERAGAIHTIEVNCEVTA